MITTNASDIAKEIEAYAQDVERRLQNMVKGYVTELAVTAIDATPHGDDVKYRALYQRRTDLQPIDGLAQGAWVVTYDPNIPFVQNYGDSSGTAAKTSVEAGLRNFKLGYTVHLGNATPYIGILEAGRTGPGQGSTQAPDGITSIVMEAFKPDLVRYYQGG